MSSPDSALPKSPNGSSTLEKGILTVQDLPVEVIAHIFSFLDASSLVCLWELRNECSRILILTLPSRPSLLDRSEPARHASTGGI